MKKPLPPSVAALINCPCGSHHPYAQCCAPFHGGTPAPTAEQVMRARYCAYVLHDNAFIAATWHATTRPEILDPEPGTQWLGLQVLRHLANGDEATVEFVARYKLGGRAYRLHEVSRFVRELGWWWYLDASFPNEEKP